MLKYVLLLSLLVLAKGRKSPNGEEYISKLTQEQLKNIPDDILEDALLDVPDLIAKHEYPIEVHEVETEDGYLITMHRIPTGKNGESRENRIPVLLMHGFMGSSADWILNRPEKALGYILADAGYDIWLGNARGNYYSRKHVSRDPKGRRFWMFDWNEIGQYDLPAMIDYILEKNGNDKLHYIGHSIGTTSFFVMGSDRPEYNDKIITMQALAPIAYLDHTKSESFRSMAKFAHTLQILLTFIGQNEFMPKSPFIRDLAHKYCHEESPYIDFCMSFFYGDNYEFVNVTMMPIFMGHYPSGASSRQFVHNAQLFLSGRFRQYDHGSFANIAVYGSLVPPRYELKRLSAPVALHYSESDSTVALPDVQRLHDEIKNPIGIFKVPRDSFTHLDYIVSTDAKQQVFDLVMELMKSHESHVV